MRAKSRKLYNKNSGRRIREPLARSLDVAPAQVMHWLRPARRGARYLHRACFPPASAKILTVRMPTCVPRNTPHSGQDPLTKRPADVAPDVGRLVDRGSLRAGAG